MGRRIRTLAVGATTGLAGISIAQPLCNDPLPTAIQLYTCDPAEAYYGYSQMTQDSVAHSPFDKLHADVYNGVMRDTPVTVSAVPANNADYLTIKEAMENGEFNIELWPGEVFLNPGGSVVESWLTAVRPPMVTVCRIATHRGDPADYSLRRAIIVPNNYYHTGSMECRTGNGFDINNGSDLILDDLEFRQRCDMAFENTSEGIRIVTNAPLEDCVDCPDQNQMSSYCPIDTDCSGQTPCEIDDISNITIIGCHVYGFEKSLVIDGDAYPDGSPDDYSIRNIRIERCVFRSTSGEERAQGVDINKTTNVTVRDNFVIDEYMLAHDRVIDPNINVSGAQSHNIYCGEFNDGVIVDGNLCMYGQSDGIKLRGGQNMRAEDNFIYRAAIGFAIGGEAGSNTGSSCDYRNAEDADVDLIDNVLWELHDINPMTAGLAGPWGVYCNESDNGTDIRINRLAMVEFRDDEGQNAYAFNVDSSATFASTNVKLTVTEAYIESAEIGNEKLFVHQFQGTGNTADFFDINASAHLPTTNHPPSGQACFEYDTSGHEKLQSYLPDVDTLLSDDEMEDTDDLLIFVRNARRGYWPKDAMASELVWQTMVACGIDECLADVDRNGTLEPADFTAWIVAFNNMEPLGDQNQNGAHESTDFSAWVANFNAGCPGVVNPPCVP